MSQRFRGGFRRLTLAQILLLSVTLMCALWTVLATSFVAVPLLLFGLAGLQVYLLNRSVHRHVDALEDFFDTILYQDLSRRFPEDRFDTELSTAFNRVIDRFQDARADRDLQAQYLETVVRHVPVPVLAVQADGTLSIVNNPARRLFGIAGLRHLRELEELDATLPDALSDVPAGEQRLLQSRLAGVPVELRVSVSELRRGARSERIYSIENLSDELSARESSAWRDLIRVLTHEIMNTLTPVTSLAQTAVQMLEDKSVDPDVIEALETISRRSQSLMGFVARYRELSHKPQPSLREISVVELVDGVLSLERDALAQVAVAVDIRPVSLTIDADPEMTEQVLINLVKNAREAMLNTTEPSLEVSASQTRGRVFVEVKDNGEGIPDDVIDQVFIPFFTTKREGSGIGLSLSRQIMNAQGGDLVIERRDQGTCIRLIFG